MARSPVPVAQSRMRSPGFGSAARTAALRQRWWMPPERIVLARSDRFAIEANIERMRCGSGPGIEWARMLDFAFVQTAPGRLFVGWGPFEQLPFRRPERPAF